MSITRALDGILSGRGGRRGQRAPGEVVTGPWKADGAISMCWSLDSAENTLRGLENLPRNHPGKKPLLGAIWESSPMSGRHLLDHLCSLSHCQGRPHGPGFDYVESNYAVVSMTAQLVSTWFKCHLFGALDRETWEFSSVKATPPISLNNGHRPCAGKAGKSPGAEGQDVFIASTPL